MVFSNREQTIFLLRMRGFSAERIGKAAGISASRVQQISDFVERVLSRRFVVEFEQKFLPKL